MIGLGYRLVSRDARAMGPDAAADILDRLADAHMKLSEGQGAELLWRDSLQQATRAARCVEDLRPEDLAGVRSGALLRALRLSAGAGRRRSRRLGRTVRAAPGRGLPDSQRPERLARRRPQQALAGGDVLGGRPTVLWALALEGLDRTRTAPNCWQLAAQQEATSRRRELACAGSTNEAGVFEKAAEARRQIPRAGRSDRRRSAARRTSSTAVLPHRHGARTSRRRTANRSADSNPRPADRRRSRLDSPA